MDNLQLGDDTAAEVSPIFHDSPFKKYSFQEPPKKKKCFRVALNADGFKCKDIRIRRHQNQLLVEGKQNAKTYLGSFQRTFAYTINIPTGINPKKIKTKLGPDGVLRIRAKKSRRDGKDGNDDVEEIPVAE